MLVSAQMFEESYGKTEESEQSDEVKEQIKQTEKPFVMLWLNTSDKDVSQSDRTDRRNLLWFESIAMTYKAWARKKRAGLLHF